MKIKQIQPGFDGHFHVELEDARDFSIEELFVEGLRPALEEKGFLYRPHERSWEPGAVDRRFSLAAPFGNYYTAGDFALAPEPEVFPEGAMLIVKAFKAGELETLWPLTFDFGTGFFGRRGVDDESKRRQACRALCEEVVIPAPARFGEALRDGFETGDWCDASAHEKLAARRAYAPLLQALGVA